MREAVLRQDVPASWSLVTRSLQEGLTRRTWTPSRMPVVSFPARRFQSVGWTLDYVSGPDVVADVLITSRTPSYPAQAFLIDLKQVRGRLLVDAWVPRKTFG